MKVRYFLLTLVAVFLVGCTFSCQQNVGDEEIPMQNEEVVLPAPADAKPVVVTAPEEAKVEVEDKTDLVPEDYEETDSVEGFEDQDIEVDPGDIPEVYEDEYVPEEMIEEGEYYEEDYPEL